uniref:Uncharacterized protein n=1 Tax=Chromera velia CCMP2878 TaxID=1169474 RepID=A0A0G4HKZ1_9ALVE|eukprot:Cvel_28576.t1-p1 / transcript=Cvel_28576.t1 / gene=Cvel_28576 / organism=Chromera_velia_CCMP2878 / gene_product=hypothetical protein / transcript_product=hypothetical protein / location=Cvel_scaffold3765:3897-9397(+) / protein_length=999 / sequence_SO=supercontig / SO=protein_coding / is_pseudo=false
MAGAGVSAKITVTCTDGKEMPVFSDVADLYGVFKQKVDFEEKLGRSAPHSVSLRDLGGVDFDSRIVSLAVEDMEQTQRDDVLPLLHLVDVLQPEGNCKEKIFKTLLNKIIDGKWLEDEEFVRALFHACWQPEPLPRELVMLSAEGALHERAALCLGASPEALTVFRNLNDPRETLDSCSETGEAGVPPAQPGAYSSNLPTGNALFVLWCFDVVGACRLDDPVWLRDGPGERLSSLNETSDFFDVLFDECLQSPLLSREVTQRPSLLGPVAPRLLKKPGSMHLFKQAREGSDAVLDFLCCCLLHMSGFPEQMENREIFNDTRAFLSSVLDKVESFGDLFSRLFNSTEVGVPDGVPPGRDVLMDGVRLVQRLDFDVLSHSHRHGNSDCHTDTRIPPLCVAADMNDMDRYEERVREKHLMSAEVPPLRRATGGIDAFRWGRGVSCGPVVAPWSTTSAYWEEGRARLLGNEERLWDGRVHWIYPSIRSSLDTPSEQQQSLGGQVVLSWHGFVWSRERGGKKQKKPRSRPTRPKKITVSVSVAILAQGEEGKGEEQNPPPGDSERAPRRGRMGRYARETESTNHRPEKRRMLLCRFPSCFHSPESLLTHHVQQKSISTVSDVRIAANGITAMLAIDGEMKSAVRTRSNSSSVTNLKTAPSKRLLGLEQISTRPFAFQARTRVFVKKANQSERELTVGGPLTSEILQSVSGRGGGLVGVPGVSLVAPLRFDLEGDASGSDKREGGGASTSISEEGCRGIFLKDVRAEVEITSFPLRRLALAWLCAAARRGETETLADIGKSLEGVSDSLFLKVIHVLCSPRQQHQYREQRPKDKLGPLDIAVALSARWSRSPSLLPDALQKRETWQALLMTAHASSLGRFVNEWAAECSEETRNEFAVHLTVIQRGEHMCGGVYGCEACQPFPVGSWRNLLQKFQKDEKRRLREQRAEARHMIGEVIDESEDSSYYSREQEEETVRARVMKDFMCAAAFGTSDGKGEGGKEGSDL